MKRTNEIRRKVVRNIIIISISLMAFYSCSPEYIPNMVNSPMFSNQGEFQATISTGSSGFNAQTAVAIADHLAVMVNGSFGNESNDSTERFRKHAFLEGGIGYYNKIGQKGRYELFGGYGAGEVEGYHRNALFDNKITSARYNRFFIQPGIGISTGIFDGSFSPRIVLVQMDAKGIGVGTQYNTFIEPAVTAKFGYKYVKFISQFGFSVPMGLQELKYDHHFFIFNFGLNFNIGRKY